MIQNPDKCEALVAVDRVRVHFGSLVAVRDVSLVLRSGDLLGLVGPNGAGKTTLLRAIAGLQPLTCGQVRVMGTVIAPGAISALQHIGFTPDEPTAYEELRIREFLRFIARGYGLEDNELGERIDFWLDQVWLTEKADERIRSLSRGMRQRLGIARTLLPNPPVILLDEPAAGLDPAGRVQLRQLLKSLRDQGKALIVSSHILADLNEYCTHIAIMARGSIVRYGTVAEVAGSDDGLRCRYTVMLARPAVGIADLLSGIAGVSHVQVDRERITLEYSRHREDAATLLRELVAQQVPIASFIANTPDLEEAYLRSGIEQVD